MGYSQKVPAAFQSGNGAMQGRGGAHEEDPFEIQEQEQNDDNQLMVTFS